MNHPKKWILLATFLCTVSKSHSFSSSNNHNGPNKNSKHISQSQRFRREDEARRKERLKENIPGQTSAIPGEKDFEIDPQRTQVEWQAQASFSEREVMELTSKGLDALKMLQLEDANEAFDGVYQMKPSAYCWQAGVVKFYLGDLEGAADLFARNGRFYESRFGAVASEERIWRDACELKLLSLKKKRSQEMVDGKRRIKGLATLSDRDDIMGPSEPRKVLRIAMDLFHATINDDMSNMVLQKAKLRSICGEYDGDGQPSSTGTTAATVKTDYKMWRLSSWFYLGLHYDVIGDSESSKKCMKMALRQCVGGNGSDIIQILPMLHMAQRDFFDDDEFEEDVTQQNLNQESDIESTPQSSLDSNAIDSITASVKSMKLTQLQETLKRRGMKSSGSKSMLQERLLAVLLDEADMNSR
jgi:hypothetical protein